MIWGRSSEGTYGLGLDEDTSQTKKIVMTREVNQRICRLSIDGFTGGYAGLQDGFTGTLDT